MRVKTPSNGGTVLVTGIHREELGFGDRVVEQLEAGLVDVLRIPEGVSQQCPDVDQQFYHDTRQRELYLQLHQQVRGRYRLLIDLHSGWDENGPSADVYCHARPVLECLAAHLDEHALHDRVRLVRILHPGESRPTEQSAPAIDAAARTSIPAVMWAGESPIYVGLELYLPDTRQQHQAATLACSLVRRIQSCAIVESTTMTNPTG